MDELLRPTLLFVFSTLYFLIRFNFLSTIVFYLHRTCVMSDEPSSVLSPCLALTSFLSLLAVTGESVLKKESSTFFSCFEFRYGIKNFIFLSFNFLSCRFLRKRIHCLSSSWLKTPSRHLLNSFNQVPILCIEPLNLSSG